MKRASIITIPLLSVALMLASLLHVHGIGLPDYTQFNFGYPLPWLFHGISPMLPGQNQWYLYSPIPLVAPLDPVTYVIVDYFFWLGISFIMYSLISIVWSRKQPDGKSRFQLAESRDYLDAL